MPTDRHGQSPLTDDDLLEAVADELLPPVPPPPPKPDLVPPHIRAAFQMQARTTVPIRGEWLTAQKAQRVLEVALDWKQRRSLDPHWRSVFSLQCDLYPNDTPRMERRTMPNGAPNFVLHVSRRIPSGYVCVLRNGIVQVHSPQTVEASGSPEVFFANVDVIQWWRVP